jgi:two-component system KDP operon response regulator KdpE
MTSRLLLVEDDPASLAALKATVTYGGFASHAVSTAAAAALALKTGEFDALLLDLGLPDVEADELLPSLRSLTDIPIIVVSGRAAERDKIDALDRGADDFIAKPFLPGELLARVRAALRRSARNGAGAHSSNGIASAPCEEPIWAGAMKLDPSTLTVTVDGKSVNLVPSEYRLLRRLARDCGAPVSRADLLGELYGEEVPSGSNIVDVYISRIRAKLRPLPGGEDLVANIRGLGWKLRTPA